MGFCFFQYTCWRVDVLTIEDLSYLVKQQDSIRKQYDLLYIFSPQNIDIPKCINSNVTLVDTKVLYAKEISDQPPSPNVILYPYSIPDESLYEISLVSGSHSRFKLDKHLPAGSFERLYRCWIEKSINHTMADEVFVYQEDGESLGLLTLKFDHKKASIGLLGVLPSVQGRGIARKMLHTATHYLVHNTDIRVLTVPTQQDNSQACHWYEKQDFHVIDITYVYHWWL